MRRKVVNAKLRLSPNEEAFILKEDYERRRKLRLLQVREQERGIAFQIREGIKQRRNQQVSHLAEELRAEWEEAQSQKIQNLEKLYLASLRHMGDGHRQAKENAETLHIKARKEAVLVEKQRSAKMARLPLPAPSPFETEFLHVVLAVLKLTRPGCNIDINRIPSLKTNSSTYHHISTFPDAQLAAEEEARRAERQRNQAARERVEQLERAHVRGSRAMKKIHLAQFSVSPCSPGCPGTHSVDQAGLELRNLPASASQSAGIKGMRCRRRRHRNQERLMEELKQLQKEDLARRKQTVAQMPPQLLELPYRRSEAKEDRQRELEFAFEDMCNADRKVKGNVILHLKPEPLPTMSHQLQDEELDLSMERESQGETEKPQVPDSEIICPSGTVPLAMKTQQIPSRILFKRLLNKIRSQKSLWTIKSASEDEGEVTASISEIESKVPSMDSGAVTTEERTASFAQEQVMDSDRLTIESGPLSSEDKPFFYKAGPGKEQAMAVSPPATTVAQSSVLLHPQEEAVRIRMSVRRKQIMEIEEQKQKQLELLEQIEQQKLRLETDCFRAQLEEQRKKADQLEVCPAPISHTMISDEDCHRQMIRNYQHQLLQQNRLHKQTVETARKRLLEYQTILKERCPPMSVASLRPDSVVSGPPQQSQKPAAASDYWDPSQRLKLSPSKYQHVQPSQIPALEQSHIQVPRQGHIPQRQGETAVSKMLAKQSVESRERQRQFSQVKTHQGDSEFVLKDSHSLSRTLSSVRPQTLQDAGEVSEPLRATICQSLDSQQISSEDSENTSSKPTEPSSFLPIVPEHRFTSLPVKFESGTIQKPFTSINQSVISQMHDQPLSSSETIAAQRSDLRFLQEQLELQKKVLQARQEAQERLLLCTQKELEHQTGLPVFLPSPVGNIFPSLPSTSAESGNIQTSSTESDATVSSDTMDRFWDSSQPFSSRQTNLEFLREQFSVEKDNLQARREAQEVWFAHTQNKLDDFVRSEQPGSSWPHQVAQQSFSSLTSADTQSRKIQMQPLSTNKRGLFPSQSEASRAQDGSSGFLQEILPLQNTLKLLQEQLTLQRGMIQPRHDAQEAILLHKERCSGDSEAGPVNSLSSVVAQRSDASRAVSEVGPKRLQELYSSKKENAVLPGHLVTPAVQEESHGLPQHSLPRREHFTSFQEQTHIERVILGARKESQEFAHKQNELGKGLSSQQTGALSSPSQVTEWEISQESVSVKSDSTGPLSHFKIPGFQERLVRFSQHTFPLQDNLQEHQEWVGTEKESFQFSPQTQENPSSQQTGFSSFEPSFRLPSSVSLPSADSDITQQPLSPKRDRKVRPSHLQVPELQHRLSRLSQLIRPQQDSLKALQDQLATQREAITHSRQETQEETLGEWKGKIFPEQIGPFSPLIPQHSLASFPVSDTERPQEPCSTNDDTISSGYSEMPDRALGLSCTVLPQQDDLTAHPEHLHAQTDSFHSTEKAQEGLLFPRPCKFGEMSAEHFIQPHHNDLKAFQQQLDIQREAIRSGQEIQEEMLLQRLNKLEQRVSSKQISSSTFSSQVALPIANSEGTLQSFLTAKSDDTEMLRSHDEYLGFSQPLLPLQNNRTEQLDLEMLFHEELLLQKQKSQNKSESPEHSLPALFLSKEVEQPFIPLPFAETKSQSMCELDFSEKEHGAPPNAAVIPRLQGRLLSHSQPALPQQDNMSLQKQLNRQREALHSRQKAQEELRVQRQTSLQQQIQKHRETVKDFFNVSQARNPTGENDLEIEKIEQLTSWFPHIQDLTWGDSGQGSSSGEQRPSADVHSEHSGESLGKELSGRASKPPVSKVKCVLDLNQHELSTIQEVESPASGRISMPGKAEFYQDRDPLRVSVSREQSFLGSPLAHDPFACHQPPAQENSKSHNSAEAVIKDKKSDVEDHAVLSHAISEEEMCTDLGPLAKPDDEGETQEISQEPLSSVTVSTGSFLSYEITDLSLTDPESFSEQTEYHEQEVTNKQGETDPLSRAVPSIQVIYEHQHSLGAQNSLLPTEEESTSDHTHIRQIIDEDIHEANVIPDKRDFQAPAAHLDFPDLEQLFPHLHRQLFKPLEPHLDFDFSSPGTSQEDRDFYQQSSESTSEKHVKALSTSAVCFTALTASSHSPNTRPNQQLDVSLAHATTVGSEQSFQQLLPEFSSQESQHADLPSIYSIEARGTSQSMENQNYSQIVQNKKKSINLQPSIENLNPANSSSDAALFDQSHLQHSTPCGSTSSECSVKQLESREEMLGFEELSRRVVTMSQRLTEDENVVLPINPRVGRVEMETSVQGSNSLSIQNEKPIQNVIKTETTKAVTNVCPLAQAEHILKSESCPFRSPIPVWETETGYGILEEPDLTLVSTSDISITETDLANLTLEDTEDNEASCFQAGAVLPTSSMETSVCGAVPEPCEDTRTPPAAPGSLQEAFIKRKKTLMERSYQRQREIWNKTRLLQTKVSKEKLSTGSVSLPEEREAAQALVHQRALRLHRQLAGVKQQREEKTKQEKG
ncbi:Centrosomal protein of 295 kDa [Apodemus speciosus]|uniref:Centrosomal protein of 295 kDa n=1 Tax=Apodemus speciosus TaxID=105296 RepID=A0ABQ0F3T8_APOSI